jgi:hypothetical protein
VSRCARCFAQETESVTIVVGDEELELRLCGTHLGELLTGATPLTAPGERVSSSPTTTPAPRCGSSTPPSGP